MPGGYDDPYPEDYHRAYCHSCKRITTMKPKYKPQSQELLSIGCSECGTANWEAMARYNRETDYFVSRSK
jgi:RNase P subunit RPR2